MPKINKKLRNVKKMFKNCLQMKSFGVLSR